MIRPRAADRLTCPRLWTPSRNPPLLRARKTPGNRHLTAISWIKSLDPHFCRPIPVSACPREGLSGMHPSYIPEYPGSKLLIDRSGGLSPQGPIRIEESQMPQSRMSGPWKSQCRDHRPPRFLPNEIRETSSIPVRHVPTDVLLDQGHAILPSPASKNSFRRGCCSQGRGGQRFRDCSGRGDCLEHRRSMAGACRRRLSWLQRETDFRIRDRGAPGR